MSNPSSADNLTTHASTTRRSFLIGTGAAAIGAATISSASASSRSFARAPASPVVIASGNGLAAVRRARELIAAGSDPVLGVVEGVTLVEEDPSDMSVGLGGLPNEHGIVQLDASVMHGPTHKAGAVAALEDIVHAARVALKVLQSTDHVLIVGKGAKDFALAHGFEHTELLTPESRAAWVRWKRNASRRDDWLNDDESDWNTDGTTISDSGTPVEDPFTYGTIHCAGVNSNGDISACTTTSGLSYKIPGRVGDSPIVGAGMYVDNDIGSGGATGRGEAVIQSCGAFSIVRALERGLDPTDACLEVLKQIAKKSVLQKRHRDDQGRVNFNVVLYALRKDGAFGSASMLPTRTFAVADAAGARVERAASLY